MRKWTKKNAVERMKGNALLQQAMQIEPRLSPILDEAELQTYDREYNRLHRYFGLRNRAYKLVGWSADNPSLRTQEFYSAVINTIDDLLPPDSVDLIHSGVYLVKSGNRYKIGQSSNCYERIKSIELGLPDTLERIHIIWTSERNEIERFWHQRFEEKRVKGEWFELSDADVADFKLGGK